MNIDLFFDPVDDALLDNLDFTNTFGHAIHVNMGVKPSIEEADLVLIGLTEERGSRLNTGVQMAPDAVRKELYRLKKGTGSYRVVDLGNLNNGNERLDTCFRLKEVCEHIMQLGAIPVVIGGTHDLSYGQYLSYEGLNKLISRVDIDAYLDAEPHEEKTADSSHLRQMMEHQPNHLMHYGHMGYQSYLVDPGVLKVFEQSSFDRIRLGEVRENLEEMEPMLRMADMIAFDMQALKSQDFPGKPEGLPFGLTGEEACQLAWYAGLSDQLTTMGFYGFNPTLDNQRHSAKVLATMVWYFVEGFYHRTDDRDFQSQNYTKYVVNFNEDPHRLAFYKSNRSGKWWMEISEEQVVPCSLKDYSTAAHGELPDRWVRASARLI